MYNTNWKDPYRASDYTLQEYNKNPKLCEFCGRAIPMKPTDKISHIRARKFCSIGCSKAKEKKLLVDEYLKNPKHCMYCSKPIDIIGDSVSATKIKKFCNSTCFGLYNANNIKMKFKEIKRKKCCRCEADITYMYSGKKEKYCKECSEEVKKERYKIRVEKRTSFVDLTIHDVFLLYSTRGSARAMIDNYARKEIVKTYKEKRCLLCGYTKSVDVCHIKAVESFSDNSFISEVNSSSNLIYLCPNHHRELDRGFIEADYVRWVQSENISTSGDK